MARRGQIGVIGAGLALGLIAATLLAWAGLDALREARGRRATVEARAAQGARPAEPLLPSGLAFANPGRAAARDALVDTLRRAAVERRLLLERLSPVQAEGPAVALLLADLAVSGPERDVLAFARTLEAGRPVIRFARWRIARTGPAETAVRLEARAIAAWEPR